MILLFDIGNTNTHVGLANDRRVVRQADIPTAAWRLGPGKAQLTAFIARTPVTGVALCSVVPRVTALVRHVAAKFGASGAAPARKQFRHGTRPATGAPLELTPRTLRGVGIDYPQPDSIGPDRLANAVAARQRFGAPVVVVDFGTAVTFDVVNADGDYVGGIIAPGLAAMTDYLHEKTALLPRIRIREIKSAIGKSTEHAMLVGAVHGYRGLVRGLIAELKRELGVKRLPVVATGGYARLIATKLPEISRVEPNLTLEGLRLVWLANSRRPSHRAKTRAAGSSTFPIAAA